MSRPMTEAQWKAQMKKWDVPVTYLPGWATRGRNFGPGGSSRPFSDVKGIMIHHTGSDSQAKSYVDWLFKQGRPAEGIPAPLAQAMSMMDGKLIMGARGRANHAGKGMAHVLDKVIAETVPLTSEVKPGGTGSVDGNARFYGDEVAFDGGQPMTTKQYDTTVRWCAAICDFHGWTGQSIIGHGEWTSAKWDPGKTDMAKLRRDVNALLKRGPKGVEETPRGEGGTKLIRWYGVRTLNVKGNDTEGARTFKERAPKMAKDLATANRTFLALQELREDQEPQMTRELAKYGYALARHADLLAIYYKSSQAQLRHSKVEFLDKQNKGWKERVLLAEFRKDGHDLALGVTHLDYRDGFDAGRVEQATEAFDLLDAYGESRGVKKSSRVLVGDMNSKSWVTDKAAEPAGYRDAFDAVGKRSPGRIDYIYPFKGRPVDKAWQTRTASDHRIHTAVIMRAKPKK